MRTEEFPIFAFTKEFTKITKGKYVGTNFCVYKGIYQNYKGKYVGTNFCVYKGI